MRIINCDKGYTAIGAFTASSWYNYDFDKFHRDQLSSHYGIGLMIPLSIPTVTEFDDPVAFSQGNVQLFDNLREVTHEKVNGTIFGINPADIKAGLKDQENPSLISPFTGTSCLYNLYPLLAGFHVCESPIVDCVADRTASDWSGAKHIRKMSLVLAYEERDGVFAICAYTRSRRWHPLSKEPEDNGCSIRIDIYPEADLQHIGRYLYLGENARRIYWSSRQTISSVHNAQESQLAFCFDMAFAEYHTQKPSPTDFGYFRQSYRGFAVDPRRIYDAARNIRYSPTQPNWSRLALEAYQDVGEWESNGLTYFPEIKEMKSLAEDSLSSLKGIASGNRRLAAASNLYLAWHYGWRLSYHDTIDLFRSIKRAYEGYKYANQVSSQYSEIQNGWEVQYNLKVYYELYGKLKDTISKLIYFLDLDLSVAKLWDMTKYSFVVDWFVNVGDILSAWDHFEDLMNVHNLIGNGKSIKATYDVPIEKLGINGLYGTLTASYYHRWYDTSPIYPEFVPSFSLPVDNLTHYVEGGALIVSRR